MKTLSFILSIIVGLFFLGAIIKIVKFLNPCELQPVESVYSKIEGKCIPIRN